MWTPISLNELEEWILRGELRLSAEMLNFWNLIKIKPIKWQEPEYGNGLDGFWVVAIFGNNVIFYNDIEDGFNISQYKNFGQISEYACEQDELDWVVLRLFNRIKMQ
jgi:hypothetical protein